MIEKILELEKITQIKKSNIEGLGLFSKARIKRNTCLGISFVLTTNISKEITHLFDKPKSNLIKDVLYTQTKFTRYINHNITPNCVLDLDNNDYWTIIAIKDISKNEEITVDYKPIYNKLKINIDLFPFLND
ncbi:SET domain-containing protein-lysine N-methyltransferase [Francisella sp. XLW-1]|uniref:SET domain-containing protein-lysine N-methyltransferase n=1 Tax=Francisella sp. XLW-1 TaxID=2610887 RepID=UPI00123CAECD|nr:SET domain-containing protein [Francisella sp. XLW-1]